MTTKLDILITADNKKAARVFKDTEGDVNSLDRTIGKMNKSLSQARGNLGKGLKVAGIGAAAGVAALGFAGAKAAGAIAGLISAGSDVEEMMGKYNTVFADGEGTTEKLTSNLDDFAKLVGRNKYDLRGYAASFGDTFKPLGFATDDAAELSEVMTQLTVDLASFNNMTEDDVAQRLQSTLIGNHGNVLPFGVIINEATLKQELFRMGMEDLTGAALEQAKVQARLNLIMAGTIDAQGDAVRTGASWANQIRRLQGVFQQTRQEMGTKLLPVFTPILTEVTALAGEHLPALTDAFAAWVGTVDVDELSSRVEGFFVGLTEQVESLAAGEGLKIDLVKMIGVDPAGLSIPITFKRAGLVFKSPLSDLGLNQDGSLIVDLDFSMQGDEKIAWGDVFSFERNVALGTSDIKIAWGDVFSFERDASLDLKFTKLKLGEIFDLEGQRDIGEFFEITKLKVAGLEVSDAVLDFDWGDIGPAWEDHIDNLSWSDYMSAIKWSTFIPGLFWSPFIPTLGWSSFVSGLNWHDFIPFFGGSGGTSSGSGDGDSPRYGFPSLTNPGATPPVGDPISPPGGGLYGRGSGGGAVAAASVAPVININSPVITNDTDGERLALQIARHTRQQAVMA